MKVDPLDELEAKLFAAARDEQPAAELLQRVLSATREPEAEQLDAAAVALRPAPRSSDVPPGAKRRSRAASRARVWLLAAAALAAAVGWVWLRPDGSSGELAISAERAPRRSEPAEPSVAASPSVPAVSAPAPAVPAEASVPAAPAPPVRASRPEAPERTRPRAAREATAPQPAPTPGSEPLAPAATLGTEIGLLKQAREALRQGDTARASSLLDGYDAAHGTALVAEATLLRIEVLSAQGRTEQARALAQRFVADNPNSPLADRARRLSEPRAAGAAVSP